MSALPVVPQPVRLHTDAAPVVAPDRRARDLSNTAFASSLADARADRATNASTARDAARTSRANSARDDDAAAQTHAGSAHQRAAVRDMLLHGAMKYAAARKDASQSAKQSAPSRPDATAVRDVAVAPTRAASALASGVADASAAAQTDTAVPTEPASPAAPPQPAIATSMPLDVVVRAMPEMIAIPDGTNEAPATPADATGATDLATSNAVVAAALQLVASLPIALPTIAAPDPQNMPSSTPTSGAAAQTAMPLDGTTSSMPEPSFPALVEDHFDAPASAIAAAPAQTGDTRAAGSNGTMDQSAAPAATDANAAPAVVPAVDAPLQATNTAGRAAPNVDNTSIPAPSAPATGVPATATPATPIPTSSVPATTATAGRSDVTAMQADLSRLDPAFRDRLARVIDRMQQEYGHDVTVVETVRSQSRQDALFAQGRTAPGAVVTWTKNSKHSKGLAADLVVDGQWQNPAGYAHLAAVAKQEGLRTLGARDPGHVELPTDGAVSSDTLGNLLNDLQGDAGDSARQMRAHVSTGGGNAARDALMAQVANVAQVARVANVAEVAKVATVARPGAVTPQSAPISDAISPLAVTGASPMANSSELASVMRVEAPVSSVNMADRISHLMDLQATQDAKPLSSVLLRMDNANGIEDQIRIDTRGTSVDARLGLGNAQQAATITDRIGELRDALERRGLTADGVRVQAAPRATDSVSFSRPVAQTVELAAMRAAADSQANGNTRDQSSRDQQYREALARDTARNAPRSSTDDARHRSRREQPEERR